jgi:LCP family protein required for cell wall assembly
MLGAQGGTVIAVKVGYGVACVLATLSLVVSGVAYHVVGLADSFGGSDAISGSSSTGAMNILVMGLESRTYWNGTPIPRGLEDTMHIGSIGGNTTNTLILIHIFAGGHKAVGISIPRDDWVTFPQSYDGQAQGKIDQAFGYAKAEAQTQLVDSGRAAKMNQDQIASATNTAGERAAIDTVENLTGVKVDHFAALNLIGFYELAQAIPSHGIEVCVKSENGGTNLHDANSGANLKPGYQFLAPAQALSFVRERDNLANGDLDRTKRQQAVIDYVMYEFKHEGLLTDISALGQLINAAKNYVITDRSWQLLQTASEMQALTGKNLTFRTLPIATTGTEGGQDVNIVNPAALKQIVHNAFYPSAAPTKPAAAKSAAKPATKKSVTSLASGTTTVDVYNGNGTPGLAGQLSRALTTAGFKAGKVGDIPAQSSTQVLYGAGASASAAKIAGYYNGVTAAASSSVAAGHVEVLLGTYATSVPSGIGSSSGSASTPSASPSASASPSGVPAAELQGNGQAGGAVTVKANAPYGIPCVY